MTKEEQAAIVYFKKVIPHLANDEYYINNINNSMTIQAFLSGYAYARKEEQERTDMLAESFQLYIEEYLSHEQAIAALVKWREGR